MAEGDQWLVTEDEFLSATVNADGELQWTRQDGTVVVAGVVVGPVVTDADMAGILADPASTSAGQLNAAIAGYGLPAYVGTRPGHIVPGTGLYMNNDRPIRKLMSNIGRARAGVEPCRMVFLGDSIVKFADSYEGGHVDISRKRIASAYGLPALSGLLFMVDYSDKRVTFPVGSSANWANQAGYGPVGKSALSTTSTTARMTITFTEDFAFDAVTVYFFTQGSNNKVFSYSLDGGSETNTSIATVSGQAYGAITFNFAALATSHTITLGMPDQTNKPQGIVAVEPHIQSKKYIAVTRGGVGGAQSYSFVRHTTGYEQYTGTSMFYPKVYRPHLLHISLGVNDALPPSGASQIAPADYATYLTEIMGWKATTDGVVQLETQVPNQIEPSPAQTAYGEVLYDLADANPDSTWVSDRYTVMESYAEMGGTAGGMYADGTHPSSTAQQMLSSVETRFARL